MQRTSVRERSSQALSRILGKASKPVLRVIDGGEHALPDWLELLGRLLFIFAHRKKKPQPTPAFFDEVPDTGVREIPVYRPVAAVLDGEVTDERLDEILRDAVPLPRVQFRVSGEKPKPMERKHVAMVVEEDPFPRRVSSHALGQFARAYLKVRGRLGAYIDQKIEMRIGKDGLSRVEYAERLRLRRLERKSIEMLLLRLSREEGQLLRENQESLESGIDVLHIARGPSRSYFLRFDPKTGMVLSFHSSEGFNRHKAYRRARKKSYREGGRRFH